MEKLQYNKNLYHKKKKSFSYSHIIQWYPIAFLIFLFFFVGYHCPIRLLIGISCPGCGMTRAWLSFVQLDIYKAFYYHPLFFLAPIFLYILFGKKPLFGNKRKERKLYIFIIFAFMIVYIIRIMIPNEIVSIHIENGYLFQFLNYILGGK